MRSSPTRGGNRKRRRARTSATKTCETYLEHVDKLGVCDVSVLVLIEVVEDDAELLSGKEDAKLGHEFFELQFLENSILVAIEALKTHRMVGKSIAVTKIQI